MTPNDTDPQRSAPFSGRDTEPGAPPEPTAPGVTDPGVTDPGMSVPEVPADRAASLLADLAKAPLPTEGVRETSGHAAAAAAVAPHRPPRAMEDGAPEPAVLINMTAPLHPAAEPPRTAQDVKPPVVREGAPRPMVMHSTVPSLRKHQRRVVIGVAAVLGSAAVAAVAIVLLGRSSSAPPVPESASPSLAPSPPPSLAPPPPPPLDASALAAPRPSPRPAPPPPTVLSTASTSRPTASASSAPRPPHPTATGSFAEPDRNF